MSDGEEVKAETRAVEPLEEVVLGALASAVLAVPGVVRLEPVLSTSARKLMGGSTLDGIRIVDRRGVVDADVNVALSRGAQARSTARAIGDAVRACLTERGLQAGSVVVNVLELDVDPDEGSDNAP